MKLSMKVALARRPSTSPTGRRGDSLPKGRQSAEADPPAVPAGPPYALPGIDKHRGKCSICRHPQLAEIEHDFIHWASPREIARRYRISRHDAVYRHAHALGLFPKRNTNVQRALDRIIEHADEVRPNAAAVVAAIRLAVDLNTKGEWAEPADRVYTKQLFDRMSSDELDAYARDGALPAWFREALDGGARGMMAGESAPQRAAPALPSGEDEPKRQS